MAQTTTARERQMDYRTAAQWAALVVGVMFILVGIAGFIPGITQDYDQLGFVDHEGAQLLGLFEVNILHNVAHLLLGIAGVVASARHVLARQYLIAGGILYGALWIFGLLVDFSSSTNFLALNSADNWLHLLLALGMVVLGLALGREVADRRASAVS